MFHIANSFAIQRSNPHMSSVSQLLHSCVDQTPTDMHNLLPRPLLGRHREIRPHSATQYLMKMDVPLDLLQVTSTRSGNNSTTGQNPNIHRLSEISEFSWGPPVASVAAAIAN